MKNIFKINYPTPKEGSSSTDKLPEEVPLPIGKKASRFGSPKSFFRAIDRAKLYQGVEAIIINANSRVIKSHPEVSDGLRDVIKARGGFCFVTHSLGELRGAIEQLADKQIGRIYLAGGDGTICTSLSVINQIYPARGLPLPEIAILGGGTAQDTLNWLPGDYKQGRLLKTMDYILNNIDHNFVVASHLKTIRVHMRNNMAYDDLLGQGEHEFLTTAFGTGGVAHFLRLYNQIPNKAIRHFWIIFFKYCGSRVAIFPERQRSWTFHSQL